MNTNEEMLQFLHKSAEMSVEATTQMIAKTHGERLKGQLYSQLSGYKGYKDKAASLLKSHGLKPQDTNMGTKAMTTVGINLNTMIDSTDSHIAEIMINGSNMGVVKMKKHLNRNTSCPEATRSLCNDMIDYEKACAENLGVYLS